MIVQRRRIAKNNDLLSAKELFFVLFSPTYDQSCEYMNYEQKILVRKGLFANLMCKLVKDRRRPERGNRKEINRMP